MSATLPTLLHTTATTSSCHQTSISGVPSEYPLSLPTSSGVSSHKIRLSLPRPSTNPATVFFSLQRTTDSQLFERACRAALERNRYNYGFIKNLIESKCAGLTSEDEEPTLFPADHENIRGKEYFQ